MLGYDYESTGGGIIPPYFNTQVNKIFANNSEKKIKRSIGVVCL